MTLPYVFWNYHDVLPLLTFKKVDMRVYITQLHINKTVSLIPTEYISISGDPWNNYWGAIKIDSSESFRIVLQSP